jgi:hypothetical protein
MHTMDRCRTTLLVSLTVNGLSLSVVGQTDAVTQGDGLIAPKTGRILSFRMSDSVRTECNKDHLSGNDSDCVAMNRDLTILAEQPRDEAWAKRTEQAFREWIKSNGSKYTIRSLECRQTLCAVEVSSTTSSETSGAWPYEFWRRANVLPAFGGREPKLYGFETDALGSKIVVGVTLFERRI